MSVLDDRPAAPVDVPEFRYSDGQWQAIVSHCREAAEWRSYLESAAAIFTFYQRYPAAERRHLQAERDARTRICEAAAALRSAIEARAENLRDDRYAASFGITDSINGSLFFDDLMKQLRSLEDRYRPPGLWPRSGRREHRDHFIRDALYCWRECGGELRFSRNASRTVDGPLIRFLFAVLNPAFDSVGEHPPTREALASFIQRNRPKHR